MNLRELNYSRYFLVVSDGIHFPQQALKAAAQFAQGFEKGLFLLVWNDTQTDDFVAQWTQFASALSCPTLSGCYLRRFGCHDRTDRDPYGVF